MMFWSCQPVWVSYASYTGSQQVCLLLLINNSVCVGCQPSVLLYLWTLCLTVQHITCIKESGTTVICKTYRQTDCQMTTRDLYNNTTATADNYMQSNQTLWQQISQWPVMVNPVWNDAGYPLLASTTPTAACSELNSTSDCVKFPFTHFMKILNKSLFNSGNITCNN